MIWCSDASKLNVSVHNVMMSRKLSLMTHGTEVYKDIIRKTDHEIGSSREFILYA
jgi:hypothetical protein